MPYQCMAKLGNVLLAARESSIDSLNISDGSLISTWTCPSPPIATNLKKETLQPKLEAEKKPTRILEKSESSSVEITLHAEPPAKKRRITKDESEPSSKVEENGAGQNEGEKALPKTDAKKAAKEPKKKKDNRSEAVASGLGSPAVIALVVTKDGKHVVAVTGEDKSIRLFENISENGTHSLKQLSQRYSSLIDYQMSKLIRRRPMPKRPCALTLTQDSSTIISADKFGDVYSLPLIPTDSTTTSTSPSTPSSDLPATETATPTEPKTFTPAANEFTIHSIRNLRALENQRRQPAPIPTLPVYSFTHTLLLGHVSMLTDVILASSASKEYIITADRDEHIRVSHGIPKTHIIETYCLGHTEFVSRLCIPSSHPSILISGGGNNELFVWEWSAGKLVSKVDIASHVNHVLLGNKGGDVVKPAISSIQHMRGVSGQGDRIVVTSEGVPAIFIFSLTFTSTSAPTLKHTQTLTLPGNALSLILDETTILISIDTIHRSGSPANSTSKPGRREERERREDGDVVDSVLRFGFDGERFGEGTVLVRAPEMVDVESEKGAVGRLENLLYGLENLRKRDGEAED